MEMLGWICAAIGFAGFAGISVVLWRADVRSRRLPNRWLIAAALWLTAWLGAASLSLGDPRRLAAGLIAALGYFLVALALWLRQPHSFGAGDVKLMPICAFAVGWIDTPAALIVFPIAIALGMLSGVVIGLRRPGRELPFGPPLIAATWVTTLGGSCFASAAFAIMLGR